MPIEMPIPIEDLQKVQKLVEDSAFDGCVNKDNEAVWLRYDTDDCDPKEQWSEYCDVQERLQVLGLKLIDPQLEHDCISGDLVYYWPGEYENSG
mgnify:CR=1 FL=1